MVENTVFACGFLPVIVCTDGKVCRRRTEYKVSEIARDLQV